MKQITIKKLGVTGADAPDTNDAEKTFKEAQVTPGEGNVPEGNNLIEDSNKALNGLVALMKGDSERERIAKAKNTDGQFFFAVYFQNKEQKEKCLTALKMNDLTTGQYIRGIDFAKRLGIIIEEENVKPPGFFKGFKKSK